MLNRFKDRPEFTVTAGGAIVGGTTVEVVSNVGIAGSTVASGEDYILHLIGVFEVVKLAGATWTQGQKILWDNSNSYWETIAGSDVGATAAAAATSAAVVGFVSLPGVSAR